MKNIFGAVAFCVVSMLALPACEDDHNSVLPTFGGFRLEPTAWHSGDSITVTAVQQTLGDLIYRAKYTWTIECAGLVLKDTTYTVVYDNDKSDPYVGFRIPEDVTGSAGVTFKAEYSYSALAPQSVSNGINDGKSGLFGNIRATGNSELYGFCGGSTSHVITAP